MKVIYFGTPQFAADVLQFLLDQGVNIAAVITKPDRPQGRSSALIPTPVKQIALAQNPPIPVFQPEIVSNMDFAPTLANFQADLFVVVAYGEILKQHLLDMPKTACINLHASILPKFRGAAPIQRSIIEGETETGVTVIHMAKKMDAGDMVSVQKVPIGENTTYGELEQALCTAGSELLLRTIHDFETQQAQRTPQDHEKATFAPKIELEDCEIDWKKPANTIHNLVRGVNPHPGAWCYVNVKEQKKRLKIFTTRMGPTDQNSTKKPPGTILNISKEGLLLKCSEGSLYLIEIQLEGKKAMRASDFARGMPEGSLHFT